ncbi:MAG: C40 family peptidase [Gammaproteobacteria bacterium]|nr:C40 family peptidase [Gammaproteobacteria bacterium]MCP5200857.1 C40 family peptidase [Gammaproteobacteria bacterium]
MRPLPPRLLLVLLGATNLLGGCGLLGGGAPAPIEDRNAHLPPPVAPAPRPAAEIDPRGELAQALYAQYEAWHGTPYRLGGSTRAGIDCSAFVAETFRSRLAITLPRSTEAQARSGREVPRDELQMGDLVFFKTGLNSRHVGIYLRNGEFMHASRLVGVTISKLRNRYWRAKWWQARRVLD